MSKLNLTDISNLLGSPTSAATTINQNSALIEQAFDNTLSRDGSQPNQMLADIDMNHNDILNAKNVFADTLILDGNVFSGDSDKWIVGVGIPSDAVGNLSDLYLNSQNGDIYGPKSAEGWGGVVANIKGPPGPSGSGVTYVPTIANLKALDPLSFPVCILTAKGREGIFIWTSGDYSSQVTLDVQNGIYVKADSQPANVGAWVRKYDGFVYPRWWGSDQLSIENSHNFADDIILDQPYSITTTSTWPNGKNYLFIGAGGLDVATGVTLTIRGVVNARIWESLPVSAPNKIFNCIGTGVVVGIRKVRPEWWGAVGNGSTNDSPAINQAIACVEGSTNSDGDEFEISFGAKTYAIGSFIGFSPSSSIHWRIRGCGSETGGTVILAKSSMTDATAFWVRGQSTAGNSNASWSLSGFLIVNQTAGSGATVGLQIGEAAKYLNGQRANTVTDVVVKGFAKNRLITGKLTRLIDFTDVSDWPQDSAGIETTGAVGLAIEASSANDFVGDLNFNSGQTVGTLAGGTPTTGTTSGVGVSIVAGASGSAVSGIRFSGFIWYYALTALSMFANAGGNIRDIWVNPGCQFEGAPKSGSIPTAAIIMNSVGTNSLIAGIFIDKTYMSGLGWWNHIKGLTSSNGSITNVTIDGGYLRNAGFGGISFDGTSFRDITISNVQFPAAEAAVTFLCYFKNVIGLTLTGISMSQSAAIINSFIFLDTGCNWVVAVANNSQGQATTVVNNASGGANLVIANNA